MDVQLGLLGVDEGPDGEQVLEQEEEVMEEEEEVMEEEEEVMEEETGQEIRCWKQIDHTMQNLK